MKWHLQTFGAFTVKDDGRVVHVQPAHPRWPTFNMWDYTDKDTVMEWKVMIAGFEKDNNVTASFNEIKDMVDKGRL